MAYAGSVSSSPPRNHYRWVVCGLLFVATAINYMDRQILGILAPVLEKEIGWDEIAYGKIVSAFQAAYALGFLGFGALVDRLGSKIGLALALGCWSLAGMAHALARTPLQFGAARFALGLGESGNFPASIKTVAEQFPLRERALAAGIFNSGTNVGAIIAPLAVPTLALRYGWRGAFLVVGAIGLLWLVAWLMLAPPPMRESSRAVRTPWLPLLRDRRVWAFAAAKFLTDPIWWFYLYWIPKYLSSQFGLSLETIGAPLVAIYLAADAGSIGGGWASSRLVSRGWAALPARKAIMLGCALCVLPVIGAAYASDAWAAAALIGLAAAAHQGWSANLFTTVSDTFPAPAVASVVGIGGTAGAIGGMLIAAATGYVLAWTHSYTLLFCACAGVYLAALLLYHLLVPEESLPPTDPQ